MKKFKWILLRWAKALGISGVAGLVLFLFSIVLYFSLVLPGNFRITRLAYEMQNAKTVHPPVFHQDTEGQRVQKFYAGFPSIKRVPDLLEKIYAAARDETIRLEQGKYSYTTGKRLGEYQVNFPVKGSYVQIRKFIAQVLNEIPSAALDDVSFKRESISDSELDAKIRFTIFVGDDR